MSKKLNPRFIDLFIILTRIGVDIYKLKLHNHTKIHLVFYVSLIQNYSPRYKQFTNLYIIPLPPIIMNEEEEYEVKRVL